MDGLEQETRNIPSLTISLAAIFLLAYLLVLVGALNIETLSLDPGAPGAAAFLVSPFLHGNLLHVLIMLAFFVPPALSLERRAGAFGTFLLLLVANLFGSLTWVLVTPGEAPPLIGAAAGVTGLWAAYTLFHPRSALTYILLVVWAVTVKLGMPVDGFTSDALSQVGGGAVVGIGFGIFWRFVRRLPEAPAAEDGLISLLKRLSTSSDGTRRHHESPAPELPRRLRLALENDPENVEANQDALDHLLSKGGASGDILRQGRSLIRLHFKHGDTGAAFELYGRLLGRLGTFDLTPDELARLVADRLAKGEWVAADTVLAHLLRLDPANPRLPDFVQRLVRMVLIQRGVSAEPVKRWVAFLDAKYPAHPVTSAVHREMEGAGSGLINGVELSTDTALPIIPENAKAQEKPAAEPVSFEDELETVRSLLESGETSTAATILSHNQDLIGQFDPFILYTVVEKLMASEETRLKGVYLLELTIRGHLNHPNTPQLVGALIVLYANDLHQPALAHQWLAYMQERWPGDPALSGLQNSVRLSQAHA